MSTNHWYRAVFVGDPKVQLQVYFKRYMGVPDDYEWSSHVVDSYPYTHDFHDMKIQSQWIPGACHEDYDRLRPLIYVDASIVVLCYLQWDEKTLEAIQTKVNFCFDPFSSIMKP